MNRPRNQDNKKVCLVNTDTNHIYEMFTNMISELTHMIHNIITPVYMTLQFIYNNSSKLEQNKENIKHSISGLNRLYDLLKEVRNYSYEKEIEKRSAFLKDTVDNVYLQNLKLLETKNIIFINEIDDSVKVFIDEEAFNQILHNLFQNTMNCLSDSGIGMIRINVEEIDECFVKLVYRNNGPLIPEDSLEKIFIPNFSTNSKKKRLGLGIALKLMTRMDGTIRAEVPEKGWGCKFVLLIPVLDNMCSVRYKE